MPTPNLFPYLLKGPELTVGLPFAIEQASIASEESTKQIEVSENFEQIDIIVEDISINIAQEDEIKIAVGPDVVVIETEQ